MRSFFALTVLLLLVLCPHTAQAQGAWPSQGPGVFDAYAGFPLTTVIPVFGPPALSRAGGGVSEPATPVRPSVSERLLSVPVLPPLALPNPGFALFIPHLLHAPPSPTRAADAALHPPAPVAGASAGTVRARAETVYYEVEGRSRKDIAAALRQHGPRLQGTQFFGVTEWEVSTEYRPLKREAGCSMADLTVRMSVQTHLPRWTPPTDAPAGLYETWERFISALDHHEHGHRELAEEAADVIRRRLASVHAPACDELDFAAQREVTSVMREYQIRNQAYDAETEHGRTQGAVWSL